MGFQQNIQRKLGVPIAKILHQTFQNSSRMTILDIFDANKLGMIVLHFIPTEISLKSNLKNGSINDYDSVWQILKELAKQLNIDVKHQNEIATKFLHTEKIDYEQETIDNRTWGCLRILCGILFQLMVKDQNVLYLITKMDEKYQVQLKQYIESNYQQGRLQSDSPVMNKNHLKVGLHHDSDLVDKIYELEHSLVVKDQQIAKFKQKLNENKQQISTIKIVLQQKQLQIGQLKKRIEAYTQADVLFQQKDQQISKLNMELTDLKLKSHVKTTELSNQLAKLKQKYSQLQIQKNQLVTANDELISRNQLLTINKQETDSTNKKVIANLKQKIKTLTERLNQQQKNLMEMLTEKEQKQKQIFQLQKKANLFDTARKSKIVTKHQDLKYSGRKSSKLVDQLGQIVGLLQNQQNNLRYFQILFGDMSMRCTGELCIALRSQYVRFVQQILKINNDLQSLQYITPKNRLQCILNQINKIHECWQQNTKLKQKIILMQSQGSKGTSKQSLEQINKLKKKILVLKRNIEEIENKKKQQIQILISVLSDKFGNDRKV